MLPTMQVLASVFRFALSVLVCLAISVSPALALFGVQGTASDTMTSYHSDAPCHMPCEDCGGGNDSLRCAFACAGLAAGVLARVLALPPVPAVVRVGSITSIAFSDRSEEPDHPPPKVLLA